MNKKHLLLLALIGLLVIKDYTFARSIRDDDEDDDEDDSRIGEKSEKNNNKLIINTTEQETNGDTSSSKSSNENDKKKSNKNNKAWLNWEKIQKKLQEKSLKQEKKKEKSQHSMTKKTTVTTTTTTTTKSLFTHEYEIEIDESDSEDEVTVTVTTPTFVTSTKKIKQSWINLINNMNVAHTSTVQSSVPFSDSSNVPEVSTTEHAETQSAQPVLIVNGTKETLIYENNSTLTLAHIIHSNETISVFVENNTANENVSSTDHVIVDQTINRTIETLMNQNSTKFLVDYEKIENDGIITNLTESFQTLNETLLEDDGSNDSKAQFEDLKFNEKLLQALKTGINLNNINGTTNIIVAIAGQGGSINFLRNDLLEEIRALNKTVYKYAVINKESK